MYGFFCLRENVKNNFYITWKKEIRKVQFTLNDESTTANSQSVKVRTQKV